MHYDLTPEQLAAHHARFVTEYGVNVVGRLLRHRRPTHLAGRRRGLRLADARPPAARLRAGCRLDLQPRALRPVPVVPGRRRTHQRQRVEEVPRGHAGRRLGHVRGDGPRGGQGRGPRARRLRRLHRRGRRRRHGRGGEPLRHAGDPADHARLHRAAGHRGRPAADRRQADPQLGQPRGRRRARHPARLVPHPRPRVRRGGGRAPASTPTARPARRSGSCAPPGRSTTWPSTATAWPPRTSSSTRSPSRSDRAWRRAGATASRPSKASGGSKPSCPACTPSSGCPTCRFGLDPAVRHVLNSVFLHECQRGRARRRHRPRRRGSCRWTRSTTASREVCLDLIYDRRTRDGLRPALGAAPALRRRQLDSSSHGGPQRLDHRAAPRAAHHRRRPRRARGRSRRAPCGGLGRPRHRQRPAARRHEDRRRPLRRRARCSCRSCCSRPRP